MNIIVVIVTFNKKVDLIKAIESLSKQTKNFERLVIIDNNSNDGTREELLAHGLISTYLDTDMNVTLNGAQFNVTYKNTGQNIGGAGGFSLGQQIALDNEADYIWFMDDDAISSSNTLELLYDAIGEYDIVNPLVINIDNHKQLSFGLSSKIKTVSDAMYYKDERGYIPNLANPFNGTFYSQNVVKMIGKVKAEMFIWGDESEYMKRAQFHGLKIATVVNAKVFHPATKTTKENFFFNCFEMECKPEHLKMNFYRNIGFLNSKYNRKIIKHRFFIKAALYFCCKRDFSGLYKFSKYYFDGLSDKYKLPPFS